MDYEQLFGKYYNEILPYLDKFTNWEICENINKITFIIDNSIIITIDCDNRKLIHFEHFTNVKQIIHIYYFNKHQYVIFYQKHDEDIFYMKNMSTTMEIENYLDMAFEFQ